MNWLSPLSDICSSFDNFHVRARECADMKLAEQLAKNNETNLHTPQKAFFIKTMKFNKAIRESDKLIGCIRGGPLKFCSHQRRTLRDILPIDFTTFMKDSMRQK